MAERVSRHISSVCRLTLPCTGQLTPVRGKDASRNEAVFGLVQGSLESLAANVRSDPDDSSTLTKSPNSFVRTTGAGTHLSSRRLNRNINSEKSP